jgi:glycerol kinase
MEAASGVALEELKADGGAVQNKWLMRFQADMLGVPVVVPEIEQTTALGAAYLAGVGAGLFTQDRVASSWRARSRYEPAMSADQREHLLAGWHAALHTAREHG